VRFTFSSNVALAVLVLGGALGSLILGLRGAHGSLLLPLTALQILWINFLGDGPTALALSKDRCRGTMLSSPRARDRSLLDEKTQRFVLLDGFAKGALGLGLLLLMPRLGSSLAATGTSLFLFESIAKLMSAYPSRKLGAAPERNPWLHGSVVIGALLGLLCIWLAPMRDVLGLVPISSRELLLVLALLTISWGSGELAARIARQTLVPKLHTQPT
jgi:Ca2+-transporting ATPase